MQSTHGLAGTESTSFFDLYQRFREIISGLDKSGPEIQRNWQKAKQLYAKAKDPQVRSQLEDQLFKWSAMWQTHQEIADRIAKWREKWERIWQSKEKPAIGLGFIPFVLPAWAIATLIGGGLAALAYVVNRGMDLLGQIAFESKVLKQIEQRVLTAEQGAQLIKAGKEPSEPLIQLGTGAGLGIIALVAAGLWWLTSRST